MYIKPGHAKNFSNKSDCGSQLGGFEYKEDNEGFKRMGRVPITEYKGFWKSKLSLFSHKKFGKALLRLNQKNWKYLDIQQFLFKKGKEKRIYEQQFIVDRLQALGCDLAAAHFVVFRGGAVKFCNQSKWIRDDETKNREYDDDLPNSFHPDYILEAIDFSLTNIIYEGLKNCENLRKLKWLSFVYCPHFDDWCLDRISGEFSGTLEYLDISYSSVSHHGLSALYRFKNLKTLKVYGISDKSEFVSTCQALKDTFPELKIEGISEEKLSQQTLDTQINCNTFENH